MSRGESERRNGPRIPVNDLPELLKQFKVDLGTGELLDADTVDANKSGMSLLVPIHINKVQNYDIIIHAMDGSFSIEDEIVYIKGLNPKESADLNKLSCVTLGELSDSMRNELRNRT